MQKIVEQDWEVDMPLAKQDCLSAESWTRFMQLCLKERLPEIVYRHLPETGESFISNSILLLLEGPISKDIAFGELPKIISYEREFYVKRGRIDYLLMHEDGSVTVCEVKDGAQGIQSVLSGIGQVMGYAIQVGMNSGAIPLVRKALAFSSCGKTSDDHLVVEACKLAGVVPLPMGSENTLRRSSMDHLFSLIEKRQADRKRIQHVLF